MFLSLFLTCFTCLVAATVLLVLLGHRIRFAFRPIGLALTVALALGGGEVAAAVWRLPASYVQRGELVIAASGLLVVLLRRRWNPIGQAFFATLVASVLTYLAFAAYITVAGGLSVLGSVASGILFLFELMALFLAVSFAFESIDVLCRTKWDRPFPTPDPSYRPKVSLQIAAYNEPPDMLIETIKSVEAIDYPDLEVVVIDNNTADPDVWKPVERYCRNRPRVRFVHVENLSGYKAGALNLALRDHTDPDTELIGVIDADYRVDPNYLKDVVGYFADPDLAFLQTPQDYREFERDPYLTACYDAYKYFFVTAMPSRNDRNSIIFAGTMGLLRRSVLDKLGGWDEWTITEDAETSLRILKEGYSGLYIAQPYGQGIMPLTFAAFKSQRFRWCFGGMQIMRRHWRDLMPWNRDPANHLTFGQRMDYLLSGLQWMNDVIYLGFTVVLLTTAVLLLTKGRVGIRPLLGAAVLLPSALVASGLLRAMWALRQRMGIGTRRAFLAFANWLSVSWTVSLACLQGLIRSEGVFLRTPKSAERHGLLSAMWAARTETVLACGLWGAGAMVAVSGRATPFILALFAWQGSVYATSPYMSWLNRHSVLPTELERRRATELTRERRAPYRRYYIGLAVSAIIAAIVAAVLLLGGSNPGAPKNPFHVTHRSGTDRGPIGNLFGPGVNAPVPSPSSPSATPSPSPSPSQSPSPTVSTSP